MALRADAPLSYAEYAALADDGRQYEVVDGYPQVNPSPIVPHQVVLGAVVRTVEPALPPGYLVVTSPVDWVIRPERPALVRQPDLVVITVAQARLAALTEPPLLVVEVLSPGTRRTDLGAKRAEYAAAGAPHYWVVDLDGPSVVAFALRGDRYAEVGRATGEETLVLAEPFAVAVTPARLLDPLR